VRGFKVHVDVNPLQNSMPADTVDIEIATFGGSISSPGMNNFTYTRHFVDTADNYSLPMTYISSSTKKRHRFPWQYDLRLQVVELCLSDDRG